MRESESPFDRLIHEINSPLAVISGMAQLAKNNVVGPELDPQKVNAYLQKIEEAVREISSIMTRHRSTKA